MSKTLLIVESDPSVVDGVRAQLQRRGFSLEHTADGKGCVDFIRRQRPAAVILAVELPNGQNGYLVCREIKKDDDLKSTPVVIIGNPEKFADHKKLRTRADEYLAKPVQMGQLMDLLGPLVGGFPDAAGEEEAALPEASLEEETLSLTELMDEPGELGESEEPAEEIAVEAEAEEVPDSDADLAILDSALGDGVGEEEQVVLVETPGESPALALEAEEQPEAPLAVENDADDALSALGGEEEEALPLEEEAPLDAPSFEEPPLAVEDPPPPPPVPLRTGASADAAELRSLRARTGELQDEVDRAESRATEAEERVAALEAELATARQSGGGKGDKDYFALREAANKKDKEILRLKGELNEKEQAELEMREREVQLEQKMSEQNAEMGRKDAQLKALTSRADALLGEKKRAESQASAAREEGRNATDRATVAEEQAQQSTSRSERLEADLAEERSGHAQAREQLELLRAETGDSRSQLEQLQRELEEARAQLMEQTTAFAEEGAGLRARVAELETDLTKHEERVAKLFQRIKGEEKLRERVKKAIGIATQLLDEPSPALPEESEDGSPADAA